MSLNNNPPTSDTEVLRNMLHTPAGGKRKAKAKVLVMDPSAISVSELEKENRKLKNVLSSLQAPGDGLSC